MFDYWDPATPAPYASYTKASILAVPKVGNVYQGTTLFHGWEGFKRWSYDYATAIDMTQGESFTTEYFYQLGAQNSAVLPDITSATVAGPIAAAYLANPEPPDVGIVAPRLNGRMTGRLY